MAAPKILYTDILYGPKSGAHGGGGCFLSIFGRNFGAVLGNVSVTIGGGAATPMFLGDAYSVLPGIQWIGVQLEAACATGAIKVTVSGVDSNTDQSFTVNSGAISWMSSVPTEGQISAMSPGDHIVIRAGTYDAEIYFHGVSGSAGLPLTVMGYPGETVLLNRTGAGTNIVKNFYNAADGTQGYYAFSNIKGNLNGGGSSGFALGGNSDLTDIRCVNNECQGMFENAGGSAVFDGSGRKLRVLGCYAHDNDGSKLYHAFYFDGRSPTPTDIELAYNHIARQKGGRGIQVYGDAGNIITDVRIHHNYVHEIHLDGILFSRDTGSGCKCYNNIVWGVGDSTLVHPTADDGGGGAALRLSNSGASNQLELEAYNNTFYLNDVDGVAGTDLLFENATSLIFRNNIVYARAAYVGSTAGIGSLTSSNNLWRNGGAAPGFDSNPRTGDPKFTDAAARDFSILVGGDGIDQGSSAVSSVVTDDFRNLARPQNSLYDIGAYEFDVGGEPAVGVALYDSDYNIRQAQTNPLTVSRW